MNGYFHKDMNKKWDNFSVLYPVRPCICIEEVIIKPFVIRFYKKGDKCHYCYVDNSVAVGADADGFINYMPVEQFERCFVNELIRGSKLKKLLGEDDQIF